jgi:hypothetical protein
MPRICGTISHQEHLKASLHDFKRRFSEEIEKGLPEMDERIKTHSKRLESPAYRARQILIKFPGLSRCQPMEDTRAISVSYRMKEYREVLTWF